MPIASVHSRNLYSIHQLAASQPHSDFGIWLMAHFLSESTPTVLGSAQISHSWLGQAVAGFIPIPVFPEVAKKYCSCTVISDIVACGFAWMPVSEARPVVGANFWFLAVFPICLTFSMLLGAETELLSSFPLLRLWGACSRSSLKSIVPSGNHTVFYPEGSSRDQSFCFRSVSALMSLGEHACLALVQRALLTSDRPPISTLSKPYSFLD